MCCVPSRLGLASIDRKKRHAGVRTTYRDTDRSVTRACRRVSPEGTASRRDLRYVLILRSSLHETVRRGLGSQRGARAMSKPDDRRRGRLERLARAADDEESSNPSRNAWSLGEDAPALPGDLGGVARIAAPEPCRTRSRPRPRDKSPQPVTPPPASAGPASTRSTSGAPSDLPAGATLVSSSSAAWTALSAPDGRPDERGVYWREPGRLLRRWHAPTMRGCSSRFGRRASLLEPRTSSRPSGPIR
jgi:hypothetical protein